MPACSDAKQSGNISVSIRWEKQPMSKNSDYYLDLKIEFLNSLICYKDEMKKIIQNRKRAFGGKIKGTPTLHNQYCHR